MQRALQRVIVVALLVLFAGVGKARSLGADGNTPLIGSENDTYGSAWVFVSAVPTITAGMATGTIYACLGMASVDPYIQEFGYSGSSLSGPLTITAPAGFEVSFDKSTGYQASISVAPAGGSVSGTVYVRAAASTSTGQIFANVTLSSPGATAQTVPVSLIVFGEPVVRQLPDQPYAAGSTVSQINFTGSGNYKWTNDNPSIGLPASGTGTSILPFTTINATAIEQDANITVTPLSPGGCEGTPMHFAIKVAAGGPIAPTVKMTSVSGSIVACMGTPSASPNIAQFTVSGSNLTTDIILKTSTPNIEISTNPASGYVNTIDIAQINGVVAGNIIYVRASGSALAGALSAAVTVTSGTFNSAVPISGSVNLPGSLNTVANQTFAAGITTPINFSGTATAVTWTNDNPAIGLSASGTGNIPAFIATNNGTTALVANITATPANANGCNGSPVTFTITVPPAGQGGTIKASGNVAQLNTVYGTPSTSGLFTVSGDNLKAGLTVTAPAGFEVSTDNITFSKTVTVGSAGTVLPTAVYIRLAKTAVVGTYSGTVVVSSTGAANGTVVLNMNNNVARAPLTIIADDKSKITGNQNPPLTVTYKGFVNGDTLSVFNTQPVVSTTATINSPPGMYPINVNGAGAANYRITYVAGTLTVNAQPLSIAMSNAFTPNGDGVNDIWIIKNIEGFPNSVIRVFSRFGAAIFYSVGYTVPWDGKRNGADLPVGTYYYIIDLKNGDKPTAGWVAIIR